MPFLFDINILEGTLPKYFEHSDQRRLDRLFDDMNDWLDDYTWKKKPEFEMMTMSIEKISIEFEYEEEDQEQLEEFLEGCYGEDQENEVELVNGGVIEVVYKEFLL